MNLGQGRQWSAVSAAAVGAFVAAILLIQFRSLDAQSPSKLSSLLQDMTGAMATPASSRVQSATPFSANTMPKSVQDAMHGGVLRVNAAGQVQVYILMTVTDDALKQLRAAGATVELTDAAHDRVQARVPASQLNIVAALSFVNFVRTPTYARRQTGSVNSEGDAIIQADLTRQQFSVDGTGVRVGVISDGLKGIFASGCLTCGGAAGGPISTGDLPGATGTRTAGVLTAASGGITGQSFIQANHDLEGLPSGSCSFAGAGAEGTALLEIVHDLAPGAQLSFANASTDAEFELAVNSLAASNDVVVDDLGFYGEAGDGTSGVSVNTANALNSATNPIRTYVTSVGNAADEHYLGTYVDSGVNLASSSAVKNSGHLHLFQPGGSTTDVLGLGAQPYNLISLPNGGTVVIFLTWNDTFGKSSNNYDLYLVRQSTGQVVASSTNTQSGTQDPVESLSYTSNVPNDFFRIEVQNVNNAAAAKQLRVVSFQPECASDGPRILVNGRHERHNFNTASQSVPAQSDAGGSPVSVISVGAICSASAKAMNVFAGTAAPDESCLDTTHTTAEFFSSRGPTLDGRMKPDISAIDGVSITAAGSFENPFFGTSAAAPHVAGVAALLLQSAPCLRNGTSGAVDRVTARTGLRNLLLSNTTAVSSGPDNTFGFGLVNALQSAQKTLPTFHGTATLAVGGNTATGADVTAADLGFTDPDSCPMTRLSWTGGCGSSPDSALHCPFGTSQVSVSASNNGQAFSTLANVQITVASFSLATSPASATVTAGQPGSYQASLTPQGGAFPKSVALSCSGLPAGATCIFSPASVTPGSAGAAAALTITTTKASSIIPVNLPARNPFWWMLAAGVGLVLLGWCAAWTSDSSRRFVLPRRAAGIVLLAIAVAIGGPACGSSSSSSTSSSGASAPAVSLSTTALGFGAQTTGTVSVPQSVTLTNSGAAALTISSIIASGDFTQTNSCGSSLAASANCALSVTFAPTAVGARVGSLAISDNASGSPHVVSLSGTGISPPATPPGTYVITVVAASGALTHSATVTLIVQ